MTGEGECPSPAALGELVQAFVPAGHLFASEPLVEISDRGSSYEVEVVVGSERYSRVYADADRECDQRARFAAVFVVLTLLPPELWPEHVTDALSPEASRPEPPPAIEESSQPMPPLAASFTPPVVERGSWRLELGAFIQGAPAWSRHVGAVLVGPELRASLGSGAVAGSLALKVAPEVELDAGVVKATLTRYAARAGARVRGTPGSFVPYADAGAELSLNRVRGQGLLHPATDSAVELGGVLELGAAWGSTRGVGAFCGLQVTVVPFPSELAAAPQGEVASMPLVWFGAALGGAFEP